MDNNSVDQVAFQKTLNKTRRRRKYFFATVLVYLPALFITYKISPTNKAMGTLFGIWVAILIMVTFMLAVSKCPKCGNYFHVHGMTLLILRKCLHCQFHIKGS